MASRFPTPNRSEGAICHFFAENRCRSGARCAFLHILQTDGLAQSNLQLASVHDQRGFPPGIPSGPGDHPPAGPAGKPRSGSHAVAGAASVRNRHDAANAATNEENFVGEEVWIRYLKGAYVRFSLGATVESVAMPWEFSALRLTDLPKDFNRTTIAEYFHHKLGIQVPEAKIDPQPMQGGETVADVVMDNPDVAKDLDAALKEDVKAKFKWMPVIPPQHRAFKFNEISSYGVNCSWHKPSRTAILTFTSEDSASKVYGNFAEGNFRVDGNRVVPERPTSKDMASPQTWAVKITNVPASATRYDITEEVPNYWRPGHIELTRPSYSLPMEATVNQITNMLMRVGALASSVAPSAEGGGRRFKLTARFVDANEARDAAKVLNYKPLPFYPSGKLTVQQLHTVWIKVPEYIYLAASQDIEALAKYWAAKYLLYIVSPEHKSFRNIKLESTSYEDVAEAYAALQGVMAGELVTDEGKPLWSPSLATNSWAYEEMRNLEANLGVLVVCDRQKRTLRMLGARDKFGLARLELVELCNKDPRLEYSVRVDPDSLAWILRGGYQYIAKMVGRDKIGLDLVSEPRRIIVTGSEGDLSIAEDIYHNRHQFQDLELSIGANHCSICGAEAEYPVFTSCCHIFCARCFEDMCLSSAATHARTPAIRCYGDFGSCKALLDLKAIQENITSEALERVFEKMFTTYVASNSKQYRYCPTPKCDQVYRVPPSPEEEDVFPENEFDFNCPHCQVAICSVCHVSHDTLRCPFRAAASRRART